ncbi:MAG: hypothetical protein COA44_07815 [Arcobacter sp.]|nr:MAG: hypothetical protein COA44_07815 [Arcobacter sp.]
MNHNILFLQYKGKNILLKPIYTIIISLLYIFPSSSYAICDNFFVDFLTSGDRYSIEDENVYYCSGNGYIGQRIARKLVGVDLDSFKKLSYGYAGDKQNVYYLGDKINLDNKSFVVLSDYFVKDKNGVYFQSHKFDCDINSFKVIDAKHAVDKNNLYVIVTRLSKSEISTYKVAEIASKAYSKKILTKKVKADLLRRDIFMEMCLNPTTMQKVILCAIHETRFSEPACDKLSKDYINNEKLSLRLSYDNLTDISPLKYFKGLSKLDISRNKITDISVLSKFKMLKKLNISHNPITDISPLNTLYNLEELSMKNDYLRDISSIKKLQKLKTLTIKGKINTLEPLRELTELKELSFNSQKSSDICVLNNLNSLTSLEFIISNISDISCLKDLQNLKSLKITDSPIQDISVVSNYPKLSSINLNDTNVKDISVLKPLLNIVTVNINNTNVTDASPLSGKYMSMFSAENTPLRWCSPKTSQEMIDGVSCYETDETLKPLWKRMLRQ